MTALMAPTGLDPRFAQIERFFYVIGAQKAGTSWVQTYLRRHPQVCVPVFKELNYWLSVENPEFCDRDVIRRIADVRSKPLLKRLFPAKPARVYRKGLRLASRARFRPGIGHRPYADALFSDLRTQTVAGEVASNYALLSADTFAQMASVVPDTRFILILRDPVARLRSGIRHQLRYVSGDDGVTEATVNEKWAEVLTQGDTTAFRHSCYGDTLARLETVVPASKIAIFFYETLFSDTEIARLCAVLGVGFRTGDFAKKVHLGAGHGLMPRQDLIDATRARFAATYDDIRARFGASVPASWGTLAALQED